MMQAGEFVRDVAPAFRYAIITDSHVGPLYANAVAESIGIRADDTAARSVTRTISIDRTRSST